MVRHNSVALRLVRGGMVAYVRIDCQRGLTVDQRTAIAVQTAWRTRFAPVKAWRATVSGHTAGHGYSASLLRWARCNGPCAGVVRGGKVVGLVRPHLFGDSVVRVG